MASEMIEGQEADGDHQGLVARLEALLQASADGCLGVVVHYSGYGYAARGLCQWLVDELRTLKSRHGDAVRLVVVFHELFAGGKPWRSAFWLSPWQSAIARRLVELADGLWTNTEHHAGWLRDAARGATDLIVRPVFSNVGEPPGLAPWAGRLPQAIVFGSAPTRRRVLLALRHQAPALVRLGIADVIEVGDGDSQRVGGHGVATRHVGRLSTPALSMLLASSQFGLLDYPARYLGKSGVFAAYAAHGCVAVDTFALDGDADGLRAGAHYISTRTAFHADAEALAQMARRLNRWYGSHSLSLQADELLEAAGARCGTAAPS